MPTIPVPRFADHLTIPQREAAVVSPFVQRWTQATCAALDVRSILIRDVVLFGSRAGFVLVEAEAYDSAGTRVPGVAFLTGDSVAVLVVLRLPDGEHRVLLTRQARVPVGSAAWHEIPAGTLDGGSFSSKALEELAEELGEGLPILEEDLVLLGDLRVSPGRTDETIRVYVAFADVDRGFVKRIDGRATGLAAENESIIVVAATAEEARDLVGDDVKSVYALDRYERDWASVVDDEVDPPHLRDGFRHPIEPIWIDRGRPRFRGNEIFRRIDAIPARQRVYRTDRRKSVRIPMDDILQLLMLKRFGVELFARSGRTPLDIRNVLQNMLEGLGTATPGLDDVLPPIQRIEQGADGEPRFRPNRFVQGMVESVRPPVEEFYEGANPRDVFQFRQLLGARVRDVEVPPECRPALDEALSLYERRMAAARPKRSEQA